MKLTSWVIDDAPKVIAPDKQFTLQLRGLSLTSVEDLGMTRDKFSAIDLTNNQLIEIGGFEKLSSLNTLIANNNPELYILETEAVPNLESLCLMNCNFKLMEMQSFSAFTHMKHLIMTGNPVENIQDYRLIMIYLMPNLVTLDFQKVKRAERVQSTDKFGTVEAPTSNAKELFTENGQPQISQEVKLKLIAELQATNDINEIERIERILKSGNL